jgi:hypothetical protein
MLTWNFGSNHCRCTMQTHAASTYPAPHSHISAYARIQHSTATFLPTYLIQPYFSTAQPTYLAPHRHISVHTPSTAQPYFCPCTYPAPLSHVSAYVSSTAQPYFCLCIQHRTAIVLPTYPAPRSHISAPQSPHI